MCATNGTITERIGRHSVRVGALYDTRYASQAYSRYNTYHIYYEFIAKRFAL